MSLRIPRTSRHELASAGSWSIAGLAAAVSVAAGVFHVLDRGIHTDLTQWWMTNIAAAIGLGLPGAMIAARRPRNPIGWILLTAALAQSLTVAGREYAVYALAVHPGHLPGGIWGAWIGSWGYALTSLVSMAILLLPTGHLKSPLWWVPATMAVLATAIFVFSSAFWPGPLLDGPGRLGTPNPLGWNNTVTIVSDLGVRHIETFATVTVALSLLCLLSRLQGAARDQGRQIAVIALPAVLLSGENLWETWTYSPAQPVIAPIALTVFSCAVAAALLRYGLYQVDRAVNVAIVYAVASGILLAAYLAAVAITDEVVGHHTLGSSLVGAALVALMFAPLRTQLQAAGDRALYGVRNDPYLVMATLGERLPSASAALPTLAETVARTLKLPFVSIHRHGTDESATYGARLRGEGLEIPLVFQGTNVGRLVLGPRGTTNTFTRDERRLFHDIARQVAVAAYAVGLNEDLQHSRERLVLAREEERRRVRRDLHDGLGPTLAGIALQLDAARMNLHGDVDAVDQLLMTLTQQTRASISDIRQLVDDLRPPALDELGLESALREHANRFPGLRVEVVAAEGIDALPAAVEVAAYRIATEALTNAARHSKGQQCTVALSLNGALHLDITDDGHGLPRGWRPGTGVTSIRERAAELGGSCTLISAPDGGTVVSARLPVVST